MLRSKAVLTALAATGATLAIGAAPALAHTLVVHKPGDTSCGDNSPYTTIQSAVNAASPGDTIQVCPGNYQEHVTINQNQAGQTLNGLALQSVQPLKASIQFPQDGSGPTPGYHDAIVSVRSARGVNIAGFTIEGPWSDSEVEPGDTFGPGDHFGVFVDQNGQANITGNRITQIEDAIVADRGDQDGVAVQAGLISYPISSTVTFPGTTGSADVTFNSIDQYQKNGPTIDNAGSTGTVSFNAITGHGPTPTSPPDTAVTAQNAVQISSGAKAAVDANAISQNVYSLAPQATGILLYQAGGADVEGNQVYSNDTGIYDYQSSNSVTLANNDSWSNTLDGLTVDGSTGDQVKGNSSWNNQGNGVGVYDSATRSDVAQNQVWGNTQDGLFADSTTDRNVFSSNQAQNDTIYDCEDDSRGGGTAGTNNTWTGDTGQTSSPPGICTPPRKH